MAWAVETVTEPQWIGARLCLSRILYAYRDDLSGLAMDPPALTPAGLNHLQELRIPFGVLLQNQRLAQAVGKRGFCPTLFDVHSQTWVSDIGAFRKAGFNVFAAVCIWKGSRTPEWGGTRAHQIAETSP